MQSLNFSVGLWKLPRTVSIHSWYPRTGRQMPETGHLPCCHSPGLGNAFRNRLRFFPRLGAALWPETGRNTEARSGGLAPSRLCVSVDSAADRSADDAMGAGGIRAAKIKRTIEVTYFSPRTIARYCGAAPSGKNSEPARPCAQN
jgi:hypothetical protein